MILGIYRVVRMMNRFVCLIVGHDTYKVRWKNVYIMNFNRRGIIRKITARKVGKLIITEFIVADVVNC